MKLPKLDELEGFGKRNDLDENSREFEDLLSEFENGDLMINEQEADEIIVDDDDFSKIDEHFVETYVQEEVVKEPGNKQDDNGYVVEENVTNEKNTDNIPSNEEYEDSQNEDDFSFLPSVSEDDDDLLEEVDEENERFNVSKDESDADKKAKMAFVAFKDKISGLFGKGDNNSSEKKEKFKRQKSPDEKKDIKSFNFKGVGKKTKLTLLILIVTIGLGFTYYFVSKSSYVEINEMTYIHKENDSNIFISNFDSIENGLIIKIKNEGELSESLSAKITFNDKDDESIVCESDITYLEIGQENELALPCKGLFKDKKYKLSLEIESYN